MRRVPPGKAIVACVALFVAACALLFRRRMYRSLALLLTLAVVALIAFGVLSLFFVLRSCLSFNNEPGAYNNLLQELREAHKDLKRRGFSFEDFGIKLPQGGEEDTHT